MAKHLLDFKDLSKKEIEIPLWKMISMKYENLENRIKSVCENIEIKHIRI